MVGAGREREGSTKHAESGTRPFQKELESHAGLNRDTHNLQLLSTWEKSSHLIISERILKQYLSGEVGSFKSPIERLVGFHSS